jgi:CRP/FNR family cyclic AMP-dependent transcriptional regulator
MNAPLRTPLKFEIQGLVQAMVQNQNSDNMSCRLSNAQWDVLATYLQPFALTQNQVLIEQGAKDSTVYFLESGQLSVHYEDVKGRVRLAIVPAGSAVGEGAFFTHAARNATVQAMASSKVWCLTPMRFAELSNRNPAIALDLTLALGSLLGRRMANKPKRVAVT